MYALTLSSELTEVCYHFEQIAVEILEKQLAGDDSADTQAKWKQLSDISLGKGDLPLAEQCAVRAGDAGALLLIYTSTGNVSADVLGPVIDAPINSRQCRWRAALGAAGRATGAVQHSVPLPVLAASTSRLPQFATQDRQGCRGGVLCTHVLAVRGASSSGALARGLEGCECTRCAKLSRPRLLSQSLPRLCCRK